MRRLTLNAAARIYGVPPPTDLPPGSPDGRQIAFERVLAKGEQVTDAAIWLDNADGRTPARRLTGGFNARAVASEGNSQYRFLLCRQELSRIARRFATDGRTQSDSWCPNPCK